MKWINEQTNLPHFISHRRFDFEYLVCVHYTRCFNPDSKFIKVFFPELKDIWDLKDEFSVITSGEPVKTIYTFSSNDDLDTFQTKLEKLYNLLIEKQIKEKSQNRLSDTYPLPYVSGAIKINGSYNVCYQNDNTDIQWWLKHFYREMHNKYFEQVKDELEYKPPCTLLKHGGIQYQNAINDSGFKKRWGCNWISISLKEL